MFIFIFLNSFFQNYFISFLFALFLFVSCLIISVRFLFRSLLIYSRVRYFCFVCLCFFVNLSGARSDAPLIFSMLPGQDVNHFSVENPALYISFDKKPYVNHFSVENVASPRGDVNHLSVDNLCLLENATYNGDSRHKDRSENEVRTFSEFLKYVFFAKSKKSNICYPLIICVITTLFKFLVIAGVKVSNYRIIDTPRRVLIKRRRPKSRNLKMITVISLMIFIAIKSNDMDSSDEIRLSDTQESSCQVDNLVSLFVISKGKPLQMNSLLLLLLCGDIETNPGPRPVRITCEGCLKTIAINHRMVSCVECSSSYHIAHADVSSRLYNRMQVDDTITFTCQPCIFKSLPFHEVDELGGQDDFIMPDHIDPLNLFKKSSLNIAHLNVNGLRSKLDFLKLLLHQERFDILCLNETKIDSTITDSEIAIPGYLTCRLDRTLHGGGTMIYFSDRLNVKKNARLTSKAHESLWVELKFEKSKPIYICSLYRPPCSKAIEDTGRYTKYLSSCFDNLRKDSEVFILGDFNVDVAKKNNLSSLISELCKSRVLTQHVSSPTRVTEHSSTTIDLAISNSSHARDCSVVNIGISDHSLVFLRREKTKINRQPRTITTRSFKNFNQEAFLDDLGNLDWSDMLTSENVDEAADIFNTNVLGVLDRHAPMVERRIRHDSPPWINEILLDAIAERDYLCKIAARSERGSAEWKRYTNKRNAVIKLNSRLKKEYYQKAINDNKSKSRKLWKTLQSLVPGSKANNVSPHSLTHENKVISDKKEMASVFNKFFATIGSKLGETFNFSDTEHISVPVNGNHFEFAHVSIFTVQKIISQLDNNKATGLDGINVRALKFGSPIISFYLSHLFNLSLSTGTVPSCWKKKRVTPVFKKGDSDDVNNYRPISILPITMKIFEKVVHSQVSDFLDSSNILSQSQSGFRNKYSTDTAVICVSDFILEELGKGKYVGAVLVDLKKAFDTVDHKILLKKLFCCGFRDTSFAWFESYLSDRVQCTLLGDVCSDLMDESAYGVPQGSVLGPLLFLLYINDIGQSINSTAFHHLYADDTIIVISADSPLRLKKDLSDQLSKVGHWFDQNKLTVNTGKTEIIYFGRENKVKECKSLVPIQFRGDILACKDKVKYLGVIFDENLNWDAQANSARQKAYLKLSKIKSISSFLDDHTKKMLINALVMPHITYCSNSWSTMSKANLNKFESLLNNMSKIIPMNKSFDQIVEYGKTLMMFKGMRDIAPKYLCDRVKPASLRHQIRTRFARNNNVVVPFAKNSFASRTFINSSTHLWNNLPVPMKQCQSILSFKTQLKSRIFI